MVFVPLLVLSKSLWSYLAEFYINTANAKRLRFLPINGSFELLSSLNQGYLGVEEHQTFCKCAQRLFFVS